MSPNAFLGSIGPRVAAGRPRSVVARAAAGLLAMAAIAGPFALGGCGKPPPQLAPPQAPQVTVATPLARKVPYTLEFQGRTRAAETVAVRARVQGFLAKREVDGGRSVKKGDLLFVIDQRPFKAAVDQAKAEVAVREAALKLAETNLASRLRSLQDNAATQFEVDQVQADRDSAAAQVDLAKAKLDSATIDLGFTEIRAETPGRLNAILPDVGNLVSPSTELCTITNAQVIYATYRVPESTLLAMRKAATDVRPDDDGGVSHTVLMTQGEGASEQTFTGEFWRADSGIDTAGGSLVVEARYDNPDTKILPGTTVKLEAILGAEDVLLVPDSAVMLDQRGRYVFTVDANKKVIRKDIKVGNTIGTFRKVRGGLEPTDQVIVNGIQKARPGSEVAGTDQPLDDRAIQPMLKLAQDAPQTLLVPSTGPAAIEPASMPATMP